MATPVMELPDGRIKYSDGTIGPKPATRNLFDFGNASIKPATKTKQTTNEQIMARLLPQGTVTQQIRKATAPVIKTPATPTAVKQMQNKPLYSDSTKLAIWKQHGGDESNFDTNDFNRSASGAIYLKNEALSKIKPKETPSILPQASAAGEPATLTEAEIRQLVNDGATDEEILRVDAYERQKARMAQQKAPETIETEKGGLFGEGGLLYNIGEQIVTGGERIGEAYKGYTEGEYTAPEAIARGAAGTTQVIFSPATGLLTSTAQDVQKKLGNWVPDDIKQDFSNYVTTQATPVAESVQNWYNSQSPEQKRRLDNAGVGTELLLDLIGFKGGKKVAPKVVPAVEQAAQKGAKGAVNVVSKTGKGVTAGTEYGIKQAGGLERGTQQAIKQQPELYSAVKRGELTPEGLAEQTKSGIQKRLQDLSETGKGYEKIRKSTAKIPNKDVKQTFATTLEKEGITPGFTELPLEDRNILKQAEAYFNEYKGAEITGKQVLELRNKLSSLVSYDKPLSQQGERIVKGIRAELDKIAKEKIPGLKELDAIYGPEREFLTKVQKDILNKDGTLKDSAISTIRNLTGKGKEMKLERLENIIPGITEKVNALKAYEDVQSAISGKVGNYARGTAIALGASTGFLPVIAVAIATHPSVFEYALLKYGFAKQKVASLLSKAKNKTLTNTEANEVKQAIANTPKTEIEKQLLLPAPSGKPTSANMVNIKPIQIGKKTIIKKPKGY